MRAVDCGYENRLTRLLLKLLRPGDVFIDVGSHQGRYTLLASKKIGVNGLIIALEPVPETFQVLMENIKVNRLNNVIALPLAAWNTYTVVDFIVPPGRSGATAKSLKHFSGLPIRGYKIRVIAMDLDTLILKILKLKRADVIKIDAEGYEVEILEGLSQVLRIHRPILIIEVRNRTAHRVLNLLKDHKYKVKQIDRDTLIATPS